MRLLLFFPLLAFASINSAGDYQFWQRGAFDTKIAEHWAFLLREESRFGDDVSTFYFTYLQANIDYSPTKWFSIAPGYRQIYKRSPLTSSHFRPEYSPLIDIFFKAPIGSWRFVNRNRIQYLIFGSNPSHWLYRNAIKFITPWKWTTIEINPYIENEFFWRERRGINENRITVGAKETFTDHFSTDLFYIARFLKRPSGWVYNNIFGLNLIFYY